jgi:hypothetical protein
MGVRTLRGKHWRALREIGWLLATPTTGPWSSLREGDGWDTVRARLDSIRAIGWSDRILDDAPFRRGRRYLTGGRR